MSAAAAEPIYPVAPCREKVVPGPTTHLAIRPKPAFECALCKQSFCGKTTPAVLYTHVLAKHDPEIRVRRPDRCFECLKGFDPNVLTHGRGHTARAMNSHVSGEASLTIRTQRLPGNALSLSS